MFGVGMAVASGYVSLRKFMVMLQGKNLDMELERAGKFGVCIARCVEVIDELLAGHTALEDFRCGPKGNDLLGHLLNTPMTLRSLRWRGLPGSSPWIETPSRSG